MAERSERLPLVVILTFLKFKDFDYDRFEVQHLQGWADVEVWSVAAYVEPRFYHGIAASESERAPLRNLKSAFAVWRALHALRRERRSRSVAVMLFASYSSLRGLFVLALLKASGVDTIVYSNSGAGSYDPDVQPRRPTVRERVGRWRASLVSFAVSGFNLYPTHMLIAGKFYQEVYESWCRRKGITVVLGHSWDYSRYVRESRSGGGPDQAVAVFLDGAGPQFGSDDLLLRREPALTSAKWYPALCRFFDAVETYTGKRVVVAAHPKARHEDRPAYFGGREVIGGRTMQLVKQADFVVTRHSTAIAFAVMFRKPAIFVYSDEVLADPQLLASIKGVAARLGTTAINIDAPLSPQWLHEALRVDEAAYRKYVSDFLTSLGPGATNAEILRRDVMRVR